MFTENPPEFFRPFRHGTYQCCPCILGFEVTRSFQTLSEISESTFLTLPWNLHRASKCEENIKLYSATMVLFNDETRSIREMCVQKNKHILFTVCTDEAVNSPITTPLHNMMVQFISGSSIPGINLSFTQKFSEFFFSEPKPRLNNHTYSHACI